MATTIIHDSSEAVELCCSRRLFLKPISKLTITVTWPDLKEPSKTVSNWEVMAKLKQMAHPLQFTSIRVSKSTLDFVRFEAELETKALAKTLCQKLNGCTLDAIAGDTVFRIFASECNVDFPTRKEWESFFQDEEEWPDTLHLDGLPCKWFSTPQSRCQKPSEDIVREVFETFGRIRNMDIPALDVYREETGSRISSAFIVTGLQTFDAYLQFQEHEDLRNALETLRGMRLMLKEGDGKALVCNIKVSLDLTRHLSEAAVQKRHLERRQLEALEEKRQREKRYEREEEADRKRREDQRLKKRQEKLRRRAERQREESEKRLQDTKVEMLKEESEKRLFDRQTEIETQEDKEEELWEERKFVLVQRRLQSIRLLTALLHQAQDRIIKVKYGKKEIKREEKRSCRDPASSCKRSGESKESPGQDTASDLKKPTVCPPDTTIPDVSTEYLPTNEIIPFHDCLKQSSSFGPLQITISQKDANRDLKQHAWPNTVHRSKSYSSLSEDDFSSGKHWFKVQRKREKVYESDEFLNYILNHYPYPSYNRVYQNSQPLPCKEAGWRRMVSDDGKGFRISLRNSDGGVCTEVSISQNPDQRNPSDEDRYKWKITIKETEPAQKKHGTKRNLWDGYSREFEVSWNEASSQPRMHTTDQNCEHDQFGKGMYTIKDFDGAAHEQFSKYTRKPVSPPVSVHHRKAQSNATFTDPGKHLENISEDTYNITEVLHQKCTKRMNVEGVYSVKREKDKLQGLEFRPPKTRSGPTGMPEPDCEDCEERKKISRLSKVGNEIDVKDEINKKKKKKKKYVELEDENEDMVIEPEVNKWKKRCNATSSTTHQTHKTVSQEFFDFFESKENESVTQYSHLKGNQKKYCGKESANW
ncbi:A-kinase anchor protein 17B-like [Arapaima gigas]